ncbi:TonB-dependent outer membrane receptor [gamma proteobacterium HdN1]|nr:TonB-dependent outer membrane receptor [gamma proteobacterium HdN1]
MKSVSGILGIRHSELCCTSEKPAHLERRGLERGRGGLGSWGLECGLLLAAIPLATGILPAHAEEGTAAEPFMLGTLVVNGGRVEAGEVGDAKVASVVTREDMQKHDRYNVGDALNLLSGVTLSTNSRNEKTIAVRGFDSRQVPLFIDGIPVYVPYDGYVDFNRFTTADLAAIQVAKGYSSVAFGANALGGAINLISRRPTGVFEGDASLGVGSAAERRVAVNAGSNQGLWYVQSGVSWLENDGYPMSSDFNPTATENGGKRDNSYRQDGKLSLKLGLVPNDTDEYALSYYRQEGEKGQPPSTEPARARYWQWPYWDKESLYFISSTALGGKETLKVRLWQDKYANAVHSFTDATYTELKTRGPGSVSTGKSNYDDLTHGASVELESTRLDRHTLRLVQHYKQDKHEEYDGNDLLNSDFEDTLVSLAAEDSIRVTDATTVSLGVSRHELRPEKVYNLANSWEAPEDQKATDLQTGLFHDVSENGQIYATIAKKSRLPTLKDRYSQRMGSYIENPDLAAEKAINYEIGYQGSPWAGGTLEAALFLSDITDKIQTVANVSGDKSQMQNVGKVRAEGVEFGVRQAVASWMDAGGTYTFTKMENRSDSDSRITDIPRHKVTTDLTVRSGGNVELIGWAEHNSSRWVSNTDRLGGFTTLNLKAAWTLASASTLEAGINNASDKNYSLADGFPAPGRTWFVNANHQF